MSTKYIIQGTEHSSIVIILNQFYSSEKTNFLKINFYQKLLQWKI